MMRSIRLVVVACGVAWMVAGCVLRPQYRDLISAAGDSEGPVAVTFTDAQTGAPLPGMNVTFGEGRDRVILKTDENGTVQIPREKRFEAQNPVIVLDKPAGVMDVRYEVAASTAAVSGHSSGSSSGHGVHVPPGGVGPGQPSDKNQPAEVPMTGSASGVGRDVLAPTDGGTTAQ